MIFMLVVVASGTNAQPQAQNMPMEMHGVHAGDMSQMDGHCGTSGHKNARHCLCLGCVPVVMQPDLVFDTAKMAETFDLNVPATMSDRIAGPQTPPPRI